MENEECLFIVIRDTYETGAPGISFEHAQRNAPALSYDAGDERVFQFYKSSLKFNMDVESGADAHFKELFTGDERRYLVELWGENNTKYWSGFLLPDQYSEPYSAGGFFVEFVATDGLQSLSGLFLPAEFYRGVKSVSQLIGACLELTGLNLEFSIASAIENRLSRQYWNLVQLNTVIFQDEDKPSAYDILETLLKVMGCFVVQQDMRWYIVGINRTAESEILFADFSLNGEYLGTRKVQRLIRNIGFEQAAQVVMQPPVKLATIDVKGAYDTELIDQKFVDQANVAWFTNLPSKKPLGWDDHGLEAQLFTDDFTGVLDNNINEFIPSGTARPTNAPDEFKPNRVGFKNERPNTYNEAFGKYIELPSFVYISDFASGADVKIVVRMLFGQTHSPDKFDYYGDEFIQAFKFEIMSGLFPIISSFREVLGRPKVTFKIEASSSPSSNTFIDYIIDLKNFVLPVNTRITMRLYGIQQTWTKGVFRYAQIKEASIKYRKERKLGETITRPIKYTKKINEELTVVSNADHQVDSTFFITSRPPEPTEVKISYRTEYVDGREIYIISRYVVDLMLTHKDSLYFRLRNNLEDPKKLSPDAIVFDCKIFPFSTKPSYYFYTTDDTPFLPPSLLGGGFYYYRLSYDPNEQTENLQYLNKWFKQANDSGNDRSMQRALAETYLDLNSQPLYQLEGVGLNLYRPLDIVGFNFDGGKSFFPLRLNNRLNTGDCEITMVQDTINNLQDYE